MIKPIVEPRQIIWENTKINVARVPPRRAQAARPPVWSTYCDSKCCIAVSNALPSSSVPFVYRCNTLPTVPAWSLPSHFGLHNDHEHYRPSSYVSNRLNLFDEYTYQRPAGASRAALLSASNSSCMAPRPRAFSVTSSHSRRNRNNVTSHASTVCAYQAFASASPEDTQRKISKKATLINNYAKIYMDQPAAQTAYPLLCSHKLLLLILRRPPPPVAQPLGPYTHVVPNMLRHEQHIGRKPLPSLTCSASSIVASFLSRAANPTAQKLATNRTDNQTAIALTTKCHKSFATKNAYPSGQPPLP